MTEDASENQIINEKDINKLLERLDNMHQSQSEFQFIKTVIDVRSAEMQSNAILKLHESIDKFINENEKLSKRLFWTNVLLALFTAVLAGAAILTLFKPFC